VNTFLGIDGGGTKTRFLLIDADGQVLAAHLEGPAYYLETGLDALRSLVERGIRETLRKGSISSEALTFCFAGIPAYGEDRKIDPALDALASAVLPAGKYRCGNDMVCGWAGALAGADGINVVAGTGSIAYGEFEGRSARAGGWGELFGDEGSAYWLAREGLGLFSRMSDGRLGRGPLYDAVRTHFGLAEDIDLCAKINGTDTGQRRSQFAQLARLVSKAAQAGDTAALSLFARATQELAALAGAVRAQLGVADEAVLVVSYSGGMFELGDVMLAGFRRELMRTSGSYRLVEPKLPPHVGAALYAAKLAGAPLHDRSLETLRTVT
jgi:N-acetylglucosamine kinase-like BadF-type ATPase